MGRATELADEARSAQETARSRSTLALGGGGVLAGLLMWSFWARRSRVDGEQRERRFQALLQNSSDLVLVVDARGLIRYATPVVERMLGQPPDAVAGGRLLDLVAESDRECVQASLRQAAAEPGRAAAAQWMATHGDGSRVPVESVCLDLTEDRAIRGLVVTVRDVGERKHLEERLHRRAFFDSLTDLPNRELFEDRVGHAFAKRTRTEQDIAVPSSTSTTSRPSTTRSATPPATSCCARRRGACTTAPDPPTPRHGSAATSSPC